MIGFPHDVLVELVLKPQAVDPVPAERRAYLDPEQLPLDVAPQALSVLDVTTVPIAWEIGDSFEVRHRIDVAVGVQHGDLEEGRRLRDAILLDLCSRTVARRAEILGTADPTGRQELTRITWAVDYRPLSAGDDNLVEGLIEFQIDADVFPV